LLPTDNFQRLYLQDGRQRITFSAYFNPFSGPKQGKLLFKSNLPISADFKIIEKIAKVTYKPFLQKSERNIKNHEFTADFQS
jgi:hypothetical protein